VYTAVNIWSAARAWPLQMLPLIYVYIQYILLLNKIISPTSFLQLFYASTPARISGMMGTTNRMRFCLRPTRSPV